MKCLIDTHVWLWMDEMPNRLGKACLEVLQTPSNELMVASISTLEIGQLLAVGKLVLRVAA